MINIFKYFYKKKTIKIEEFKEIKIVINDDWNKIKNGNTWLCYYNKDFNTKTLENSLVINRDQIEENYLKNSVGYISYKTTTGQIGLFFIKKKYQNQGFGKQILDKVIKDLVFHNQKKVFAITTENHPFWSNVYNGAFEFKKRPHESVTGSGYLLDIKN